MAQAQKLTKAFGNLCRDPEVIQGNPRTETQLVRTDDGIESREVEVPGVTFRTMTIAVDFPAQGPNGEPDWDNKTTEFFSVLDFSNPLRDLEAAKGTGSSWRGSTARSRTRRRTARSGRSCS